MFELYLLNEKLQKIMLIENYQSIIWTERYNEPGDFELYTSDISHWMPHLKGFISSCIQPQVGSYGVISGLSSPLFVAKSNTEALMIIEDVKITTDIETGSFLTITGRSLESILDRRIVYPGYQSVTLDNPEDVYPGVKSMDLLPWECISQLVERCQKINWYPQTGYEVDGTPSEFESRKMYLTMVEPTDERMTNLSYVDKQSYSFDNVLLYDAVKEICDANGYGFYVSAEFVNGKLNFKLYIYMGEDKSSSVKFSPKYDNFINSELYVSSRNVYTSACAYIPSLYFPNDRMGEQVYFGHTWADGVELREALIDNHSDFDMSYELGRASQAQKSSFALALRQQVRDQLSTMMAGEVTFDGQAETSVNTFKLGIDYTLGDLVTVENEFDLSGITQIMSITESFDESNGYQLYPGFSGFTPNTIIK